MSEVCVKGAVAVAAVVAFLYPAVAVGQVAFEDQPAVSAAAPASGIGKGFCAEMDGVLGPDVVVPSDGDNELVILINDGSGGIPGGHAVSPSGAGFLRAACPGDWDNDGLMDILTVSEGVTHRLYYVRQIDEADWDDVDSLVLPGAPASMACADFNGDGLIDVAVGDTDNSNIDVYLNDGSGGIAALTADSYPMGDAHAITACDLDADGHPDLIAVGQDDNMLRVRRNDGAGNFGPVSQYLVGASPGDVDCCDLNGDGYPDIVIPNEGDDTITVLLNDTTGGFVSAGAHPAGDDPISTACGDFDCDGDVDVAVLHKGATGEVSVLLNDDGSGTSWTLDENVVSWKTAGVSHIMASEFNDEPGTDLMVFENTPFAGVRPVFNVKTDCENCIAPPTDSVAWYTGDLCIPVDLRGNHDGVYVGFGFCPAESVVGGGALGFRGEPTPAYVSIDGDCELEPDDHDFSVNLWMRTSEPGTQTIVSKGLAPGYSLDISGGRLRLVVCDSVQCWNTTGSSIINDGDWHHVAFTIDRSAGTIMRVWVDGLLEEVTNAAVDTISSPHPLLLGAGPSPSPSVYFDGVLDEVQVHERALSAAEIQANYLAGLAGQCRDRCALPADDVAGLDLFTYEGGAEDDFGGGIDPAAPGPELLPSCSGAVNFDVTPVAGSLCHTFPSLPTPITHATLELRVQAGSADACDDTLALLATGSTPAFAWQRPLGDPGCLKDEGLLDCAWEAPRTHTFCLDLNELPDADGGTTSVIAEMNTAGRLDVRVADDSAVDFMRLRVAVDPCPQDVSGDDVIDVFDLLEVIAAWGPCAEPCPPCPADVNGDCTVDVFDMLEVISSWGPC